MQGHFSAKKGRPWAGEVHLVIVSLSMIEASCGEITGVSLGVVLLALMGIVSTILAIMSPCCLAYLRLGASESPSR